MFLTKHRRRNVRSLILILGLILGAVGICLFVGALLMGFSVFAIPVGFTGTFLLFFGPWGAWQYYNIQKAGEYATRAI
jgi:small-conductance mechanosensitive channel